jgi:hypothetical protein
MVAWSFGKSWMAKAKTGLRDYPQRSGRIAASLSGNRLEEVSAVARVKGIGAGKDLGQSGCLG